MLTNVLDWGPQHLSGLRTSAYNELEHREVSNLSLTDPSIILLPILNRMLEKGRRVG